MKKKEEEELVVIAAKTDDPERSLEVRLTKAALHQLAQIFAAGDDFDRFVDDFQRAVCLQHMVVEKGMQLTHEQAAHLKKFQLKKLEDDDEFDDDDDDDWEEEKDDGEEEDEEDSNDDEDDE